MIRHFNTYLKESFNEHFKDFEVGDRIIYRNEFLGTIVWIGKKDSMCLIEFDEENDRWHDDYDGKEFPNKKHSNVYFYVFPESIKLYGKKRKRIENPMVDPFGEEDWGYETIEEEYDWFNKYPEIGQRYIYDPYRPPFVLLKYKGQYGLVIDENDSKLSPSGSKYCKMRFDDGYAMWVNINDMKLGEESNKYDDEVIWWKDGKLEEKFNLFKKKKEIGVKYIDVNDKYNLLEKDLIKLEKYLKKTLFNKEVTFSCMKDDNNSELKKVTILLKYLKIENEKLYFIDEQEKQYEVVTSELISYKDELYRKITPEDPYGEEEWDDTNE